MEIRIFYVGDIIYIGKMRLHTEEYVRNLRIVLYQFTVSLCLRANMIEAGNDNLILMGMALHLAFRHCLIETSQGKIALLDSNPNLKGDHPTIIFIHGQCAK